MKYFTLIVITLLGVILFYNAYEESIKAKDESWFKSFNLPQSYYLQEYNTFAKKQNILTSINSITSLNNRLIAFGRFGTILTSDDFGKSWKIISSNIKHFIESITILNDRLIAVGDSGAIFTSSDFGKSWKKENSNSRSWLYSITSLDNRLIAVGISGTILTSDDFGKNWKKENSNISDILSSITSLDNRLIAVGNHGTILTSDDGGKSWEKETSNISATLSSITSLDNRLIAVGYNGTILTSDDGGKSWKKENSNSKSHFTSIISLSNHLIIIGFNGVILTSDDLGKSWKEKISNTENNLNSITSLNNRLIAVGENGEILLSDNLGNSWEEKSSNKISNLQSVTLFNNHLTAVGDNGVILTSVDLGKSWKKENSDHKNYPNSIVSFNSLNSITSLDNRLIAIGANGAILKSNNLGKNWKKENSNTRSWLNSITSLNDNLIAVGSQGVILTSNDLGKNWKKENSNSIDILLSITSLDNRLIAVGNHGTILTSDDDGKSWKKETSNISDALSSITSLDNRLIAVGYNGTILTSDDGGKSWKKETSNISDALRSITSLDNRLISVGYDGTILTSDDGGKSWKKLIDEEHYYDIAYYSVIKLDKNRALAVGQNGIIVKIDVEKNRIIPLTYRSELGMLTYIIFNFMFIFGTLVAYLFYKSITYKENSLNNFGNDKAIEHSHEDKYGYRPLVDALSSLITSYKTTAPFSIVIDGAWGSGKSSIMNMVKNKIEAFGVQSIFFNVWYHQNEEHILANLIENFYAKLVPPFFSLSNIIFRVNIFIKRVLTKPDHLIVLTLLVILSFLISNNTELSNIPLAILYFLYLTKKLSAETAQIKNYLKHLEKAFKLNRPNAQIGLRQEFVNALNELLGITEQRVVLFIDDLDRCSDSEIMEILKTVNYLSEIKNLIIIMGVDTPKVKDAIARNYQVSNGNLKIEKAQELASEYLQKIFNNTIKVPSNKNSLNRHFKISVYESIVANCYNRYFKKIEFFITKYLVVALFIGFSFFIDYKSLQNSFDDTVSNKQEMINDILHKKEKQVKTSVVAKHQNTTVEKPIKIKKSIKPKEIEKDTNLNYIYPANVSEVSFYKKNNFYIVLYFLFFSLLFGVTFFALVKRKDKLTQRIINIVTKIDNLNPREQKMLINRIKLVLSFENRELFFRFQTFQSIVHITIRSITLVLFFIYVFIFKKKFSDAKNIWKDLLTQLLGRLPRKHEDPDDETIEYVIKRLSNGKSLQSEDKKLEEVLKLVITKDTIPDK